MFFLLEGLNLDSGLNLCLSSWEPFHGAPCFDWSFPATGLILRWLGFLGGETSKLFFSKFNPLNLGKEHLKRKQTDVVPFVRKGGEPSNIFEFSPPKTWGFRIQLDLRCHFSTGLV